MRNNRTDEEWASQDKQGMEDYLDWCENQGSSPPLSVWRGLGSATCLLAGFYGSGVCVVVLLAWRVSQG